MLPIAAYPGVSAHEAAAALAALHAAGIPAELVSSEALVATREGARLVPARLGYGTIATAPAAILPGGDVAQARLDPDLAKALRARRGQWTLASAEAITLLGPLGEGRRVAATPGARVVEDGRLLTCADADALVDLVLHYAARDVGEDAARAAAARLGREYRPFVLGAKG